MVKYLFIYRDTAEPGQQPSPEEMQSVLALWGAWFQKFGAAVVDSGDGLLPTGRVLRADGAISDGPYVEAKEMIGGFSIIQADSYDAALRIARECPIFQSGGLIEVRELAGYTV